MRRDAASGKVGFAGDPNGERALIGRRILLFAALPAAWRIVLPAAPATGVELTVIAYTGGDTPGTSTQFESIRSNGEFDASGRVAFRARLVGPELRRDTVWFGRARRAFRRRGADGARCSGGVELAPPAGGPHIQRFSPGSFASPSPAGVAALAVAVRLGGV